MPESAADAERFHQFLLVQRFGYHTDTVVAGAVDHLFRQICLADEDNAGAGGFAELDRQLVTEFVFQRRVNQNQIIIVVGNHASCLAAAGDDCNGAAATGFQKADHAVQPFFRAGDNQCAFGIHRCVPSSFSDYSLPAA